MILWIVVHRGPLIFVADLLKSQPGREDEAAKESGWSFLKKVARMVGWLGSTGIRGRGSRLFG